MEQQGEYLPKVVNFDEYAMPVERVIKQVNLIQEVMSKVMHEGEHWGKIPGCGPKPSLLKPGAEKLSTTFRLAPTYEIQERDLPANHREYRVICTLTHIPTGQIVGQGVGECSTMEGKYRFRTGEMELTGKLVPKEYWTERKQEMLGGKGFGTKKNPDTGKWEIARIGERVEHDNPADYYNTVLKMAKKRAHVDAVLTATAASDIFTQDVEDMVENAPINGHENEEKKNTHSPTTQPEIVDPEPQDKPTKPDKKPFDAYYDQQDEQGRKLVDSFLETLKTDREASIARANKNFPGFKQSFDNWVNA